MKVFLGAVILGLGLVQSQAEQVFKSGELAVPLVELFTSEGCSSCPPAERWLGELRSDPGLWKNFVPIAWHVNYWDRLGWPDKFADAAYTDRQYAYAKSWKSGRVYTPGFVRSGEEWRPQSRDLVRKTAARKVGELTATVTGQMMRVGYDASDANAPLWVNVARLGGGVVSDVRKGENRGKKLAHEFLVLGWERVELSAGSAELRLPAGLDGVSPTREALAIWVSGADSPAPIQATGGWLE